VDTTKSEVARAALDAGADLVNDVSGFSFDPALAGVVAEAGCRDRDASARWVRHDASPARV